MTSSSTLTPECGPGNWKVINKTKEEEDAFEYVKYRKVKFVSTIGSTAHIIKGALGAGLLSGHASYMNAGVLVAVPATLFFGIYMCLCFYLLVSSTQVLYRRTKVPSMSYPDVGESAVACFPNPKVQKFSRTFRYVIDILVTIDLYGACACYQIIIAKSIKQLVENTQESSLEGIDGYPGLRVYLAAILPPMIGLCLIRHLKWLAPFSIIANIIVAICIGLTMYYAFQINPKFEGMKMFTSAYGFFQFVGLNIFSMSCIGIVIPVEGNMRNPKKFPLALTVGMFFVILCTMLLSFFGYAAYLDKSESPITVNYPMTLMPKILKGMIALMIFVTHALNFWVPFNLCFYYISRRVNQNKVVMWELIFRAIFTTLVSLTAIIFPSINALMGFIGCLCLSNMAFIWPNIICLLVCWERPGLGKFKWRLWRGIILILIGIFILVVGSIINGIEMYHAFFESL